MAVQPYDEARIEATDVIIRRVNRKQHVVWDENTKKERISSKLYQKSSGQDAGMSVDIEALMLADGVCPKKFVTTPVFMGSVAFSAGQVRTLGLWVGYDPIPASQSDPGNPYHGEVWTTGPSKRFSDAQRRGLASAARWYVRLPGVDIP